jgi:toxin ParE1/3/4
MAQIVWAAPALTALEEIADVISLDKPDAARQLVQSIFSAVEKLERFPNLGSRVPESPLSNHRHLIIGPCRIFYRPERARVLIIFVMRGERQFHRRFLDPTER